MFPSHQSGQLRASALCLVVLFPVDSPSSTCFLLPNSAMLETMAFTTNYRGFPQSFPQTNSGKDATSTFRHRNVAPILMLQSKLPTESLCYSWPVWKTTGNWGQSASAVAVIAKRYGGFPASFIFIFSCEWSLWCGIMPTGHICWAGMN